MDKDKRIKLLIDSMQVAHDRIYKQSIAIKALLAMCIFNSVAIAVTCLMFLLN